MNFRINCDELLNKLNIIQKALPAKTSMPVLMGIKIDVFKDYMLLTTCNSDITIQAKISGESIEINETGRCLVQGKYLIDIIRKINSKQIEMFVYENKLLIIKSERSEFKLNIMTYEDYPDIKFVNEKNRDLEPIELESFPFRTSVKEILFATAVNEKRPILTGVLFKNENSKLTLIATDSYRLSKKVINLNNVNDFSMVIPAKSLKELLNILEDYEGTFNCYIDNSKVLFKIKETYFETRLLEGNYPDTSKIVPSEFSLITKFNRDEIMQAIDRVSLLSPQDKERNYSIVKFSVTNNRTIEISSSNQEIGDAIEEIIPIDNIEGPVLKIGFNSKYLTDAIRSLPSSDVAIKFTGEIKPFVVCSDEYPNLLHVILPVKLN
ncbi:MAG: DNA polymerase III subunit beta [bacterium]|nr:DNA polymerase III subunit beta [bacterium]